MEKVSEKGNAYTLLMYPVQVQRMIVEHYIEDAFTEKEPESEDTQESEWLTEKTEQHVGNYSPWMEEEDKKLTNVFQSGQFSTSDLSQIHGRTNESIKARLKTLKLIES